MTPSLLNFFDAPDDYDGLFGWICGYSADALFLDEAAERFTRRTHAQRAKAGEISLGLILDPHYEALSLLDVPGVAHLPLRHVNEQPFKLMHAKVALLGFRKAGADPWRLRLVSRPATGPSRRSRIALIWCGPLSCLPKTWRRTRAICHCAVRTSRPLRRCWRG